MLFGSAPALEAPVGERPTGECRPNEFVPVAPLTPPTEKVDVKEPLRPFDETEDPEPLDITVRRGVGDPLESSLRRRSPWLAMEWSTGSSPGGEDARRFNPAIWYSLDASSMCNLRIDDVSAISASSLLSMS